MENGISGANLLLAYLLEVKAGTGPVVVTTRSPYGKYTPRRSLQDSASIAGHPFRLAIPDTLATGRFPLPCDKLEQRNSRAGKQGARRACRCS